MEKPRGGALLRRKKSKSGVSASDLRAHIGFWMRLVSNNVSHAFARKVAETGVTVAEWVVMREMYERNGKTSPSTIASLTGLSRGAVSKLVDRLLAKKLVTRKESTSDRRYQDIELTAGGAALVPRLAKLADENDEEFFSTLSRNERRILLALLQKLAEQHQLKTLPIT